MKTVLEMIKLYIQNDYQTNQKFITTQNKLNLLKESKNLNNKSLKRGKHQDKLIDS